MAFTSATISHLFQNGDGSAATGTVTFRLTKRMTNGTTTVLPTEITANLDATGHLSQSLTSNVDAGTIPQDSQWVCTIRCPPAEQQTYTIIVPSGGGTVDLGSLLPQEAIGGG